MKAFFTRFQVLWFGLGGALFLVFLSTVQKYLLAGKTLILNPQSYFVPVIFGGFTGVLLGLWQRRLRRYAERIQSSEAHFRMFSDVSSDFVFWKTPDGKLAYVSPACQRLTGYSPQELLQNPVLLDDMVHAEDRETWMGHDQHSANGREGKSLELRILTKGGKIRWIQHSCGPVYDGDGSFLGIRGSNTDITSRILIEQDLRESEERYLDLLENANDLIQSTLPDGTLLYVNRVWRETMGYSADEISALNLRDIIHPDSFDHCMASFQGILSGNSSNLVEAAFITKDGRKVLIEGSVNCRFYKGRPISTRGIFRDVTARKEAEERVRRLAYYDTLTDLPNRDLFRDRLERALSRARRNRRTAAVAFLDLDRFKNINDTLGHAHGDLLLQEVARRLTEAVRETDTVSRFGGDEFVILMADMGQRHGATVAANKILNAFSRPFDLDGIEVAVSTSIGLALFPDSGEDVETLLKNADTAMYQAKNLGRNTYQFYSPEMNALALRRLLLTSDLRHAVDKNELSLLFQAQVCSDGARAIGAEVLLRWNHGTEGDVPPAHFIPLAEETGLIVTLGHWVLQQACQQFKNWLERGYGLATLAVNLSAKQFKDPGLAASIEQVLQETGLSPRYLELELTESMLMEDPDGARRILEQLKRTGIRLAIDDFGTGYSSLSYLKHFPIDTLKIDRSFVRGLPDNHDDIAIAEAIVGLSRSLRLKVLAEGVETADQRDFLEKLGCREMQGFLFGRPAAAADFETLLRDQFAEPA